MVSLFAASSVRVAVQWNKVQGAADAVQEMEGEEDAVWVWEVEKEGAGGSNTG